jgi:hypothetical protein
MAFTRVSAAACPDVVDSRHKGTESVPLVVPSAQKLDAGDLAAEQTRVRHPVKTASKRRSSALDVIGVFTTGWQRLDDITQRRTGLREGLHAQPGDLRDSAAFREGAHLLHHLLHLRELLQELVHVGDLRA